MMKGILDTWAEDRTIKYYYNHDSMLSTWWVEPELSPTYRVIHCFLDTPFIGWIRISLISTTLFTSSILLLLLFWMSWSSGLEVTWCTCCWWVFRTNDVTVIVRLTVAKDLAPVRKNSMITWCKISKNVTRDMPMVRPKIPPILATNQIKGTFWSRFTWVTAGSLM